jgi:hypothetical protein
MASNSSVNLLAQEPEISSTESIPPADEAEFSDDSDSDIEEGGAHGELQSEDFKSGNQTDECKMRTRSLR